MRDFKLLTKEEFLKSYSYLTEKEYDLTKIKEMNDECWDSDWLQNYKLQKI